MKATRRCEIADGQEGQLSLSIAPVSHAESSAQSSAAEKPRKEGEQPRQQPSPPATPEPSQLDRSTSDPPKETPEDKAEKQPSEPQRSLPDPIHWFGVLVPRELRSAQTSFTLALAGGMAEAVNATRALREVEAEIRRTRKGLRKAEKGVEAAV
jgi:coiled-coil domain-containing protein 115